MGAVFSSLIPEACLPHQFPPQILEVYSSSLIKSHVFCFTLSFFQIQCLHSFLSRLIFYKNVSFLFKCIIKIIVFLSMKVKILSNYELINCETFNIWLHLQSLLTGFLSFFFFFFFSILAEYLNYLSKKHWAEQTSLWEVASSGSFLVKMPWIHSVHEQRIRISVWRASVAAKHQ